MEWIGFFFALIALGIASDCEHRCRRLARRVAALESAAESGPDPTQRSDTA